MDIRNEIVDMIMLEMQSVIDEMAMERLQTVLLDKLDKYEISERSTEIVVRDGTAEGLLRKYLATKRIEGKSERTIKRYADLLSTFISGLDRRLHELTAFDIRLYLSMYKEKRKIKNRTLDNMRKVLSSFFSWLHDEEFLPRNPCRAVKSIKYDKVLRLPFSGEELEKLKSACTNTRDIALIHFLHATGCRVSEVVSVDISDVDFQNRELVVYGKGGTKASSTSSIKTSSVLPTVRSASRAWSRPCV